MMSETFRYIYLVPPQLDVRGLGSHPPPPGPRWRGHSDQPGTGVSSCD